MYVWQYTFRILLATTVLGYEKSHRDPQLPFRNLSAKIVAQTRCVRRGQTQKFYIVKFFKVLSRMKDNMFWEKPQNLVGCSTENIRRIDHLTIA